MQKARRHPQKKTDSDRLWAHGFRNSFTPLKRVLFTFPSRYLCAIGLPRVFSLAGWSRRIHTGLHVPRATQDAAMPPQASRTGLSPSAVCLSRHLRSPPACNNAVLQPRRGRNRGGLGSSPSARRYWGNHSYFLFLRVLRCFSSPRLPRRKAGGAPSARRVVPFGDPRIKGHLRLPEDYRSLSRPSSPARA